MRRHDSAGERPINSGQDIATFSVNPASMIAGEYASDALRMRALLLTADDDIRKTFEALFSDIKIIVQCCSDTATAETQIFSHKFETVVLDFDTFPGALPGRERLQQNRANKNVVIFAVATGEARRKAVEYGASFIFDRPINPSRIAQVLRTAYGLMLRDRREYFRLPVELNVSIRRKSGEIVNCKTINVSRNGMAMSTPGTFEAGEDVEINLRIEDVALSVLGIGKIIWDDRHGKAGAAFHCKSPEQQSSFSSWLDNHFYAQFDLAKNS